MELGDPIQKFSGARVLVTGGLGFIGSNLCHRLASLRATITIVDSMDPDHGGNFFNVGSLRPAPKMFIADIRHRELMNRLVRDQDFIFNLAGQVSHIDSMTNPWKDLETNCYGHLTLLEACRKRNPRARIVFASSRQIYGRPDYLPVDEAHPLHPCDVNGAHKLAAEFYHLVYHRAYGLPTTVLRLTNTYGPRQSLRHDRQGFIAWFIRLALEGKRILLFGDGLQLRDLNFVDDVVEAFLRVAMSERAVGEVYNLGGARALTLLQIASLLVKLTRRGTIRTVPFPKEKQAIDIGNYIGNFNKIQSHVNWEPRTSLEEGLRATLKFYRAHRSVYWPSRP